METIASAFLPPRSNTSTTFPRHPVHHSSSGNASKGSFGLSPPRRRQTEDASTIVTSATPSSVKVSLTRDLSDLSGSYAAESKHSSSSCQQQNQTLGGPLKKATVIAVPGTTNPSASKRWRQAKVLSSRAIPQHPQPPCDDDLSVGIRKVVSHDLIEIVTLNTDLSSSQEEEEKKQQSTHHHRSSPFRKKHHSSHNKKHQRTPILLILMDPTRKMYEILQLWIDTETDAVKDIVATVSRTLGQQWKQDYDGIFGIRNNHFSQLIHVLQVQQYDVHPYEVFLCKPWSMSAKSTVGYASTLLNHLKQIGVLEYAKAHEYARVWKKQFGWQYSSSSKKKQRSSSNHHHHHHPNNNNNDTLLVLSNKALSRVYVPGGILKHHHAFQFLSFAPPLEMETMVHNHNHHDEKYGGGSSPESQHTYDDDEDEDAISSAMSESNPSSNADMIEETILMEQHKHQEVPFPSNNSERVVMIPHVLPHDDNDEERNGAACDGGAGEEEDSTTQSTFSTSGTTSPTRTSTMAMLTTTSNSQAMESSPLPHVLPSSMKHKSDHFCASRQPPPPPRRIVRLLSALNCSRCNHHNNNDDDHFHRNMHSRSHWSYQQTPTTTYSSSSSSSPYQQHYQHPYQTHDIHQGFPNGYRSMLEVYEGMDRVMEEDAQSRASSSAPLLIAANSSDYHEEYL
jgi:hypothetical protein